MQWKMREKKEKLYILQYVGHLLNLTNIYILYTYLLYIQMLIRIKFTPVISRFKEGKKKSHFYDSNIHIQMYPRHAHKHTSTEDTPTHTAWNSLIKFVFFR